MNGITRQKVIDLCRAHQIPIYVRNFSLWKPMEQKRLS